MFSLDGAPSTSEAIVTTIEKTTTRVSQQTASDIMEASTTSEYLTTTPDVIEPTTTSAYLTTTGVMEPTTTAETSKFRTVMDRSCFFEVGLFLSTKGSAKKNQLIITDNCDNFFLISE